MAHSGRGRVITTYARRSRKPVHVEPTGRGDPLATAVTPSPPTAIPAKSTTQSGGAVPSGRINSSTLVSSDSDSDEDDDNLPTPVVLSRTRPVLSSAPGITQVWRPRSLRESIAHLTKLYDAPKATCQITAIGSGPPPRQYGELPKSKAYPITSGVVPRPSQTKHDSDPANTPRLSRFTQICRDPGKRDVFDFALDDYDDATASEDDMSPPTSPSLPTRPLAAAHSPSKLPRQSSSVRKRPKEPHAVLGTPSPTLVQKTRVIQPSFTRSPKRKARPPEDEPTEIPARVERVVKSTVPSPCGSKLAKLQLDDSSHNTVSEARPPSGAEQSAAFVSAASPSTITATTSAAVADQGGSYRRTLAQTHRTNVKVTYGRSRSAQHHGPGATLDDLLASGSPPRVGTLSRTYSGGRFAEAGTGKNVSMPPTPPNAPVGPTAYRDRLDTLLHELQRHQPLAARQAGAAALIHQLATDADFVARLADDRRARQLYSTLNQQDDPLLVTAWLFCVYRLFHYPSAARALLTERQALDVLADYLRPRTHDPFRSPIGLDAASGCTTRALAQVHDHFAGRGVITWVLLATEAVRTLCLGPFGTDPAADNERLDVGREGPREPYPLGLDPTVQHELRVSGCLAFLAQHLTDAATAGLTLSDPPMSVPANLPSLRDQLDPLHAAVGVLEYASVSVPANVDELRSYPSLLPAVVAILHRYGETFTALRHLAVTPASTTASGPDQLALGTQLVNDALTTIRLLVNLTNQQPAGSRTLDTTPLGFTPLLAPLHFASLLWTDLAPTIAAQGSRTTAGRRAAARGSRTKLTGSDRPSPALPAHLHALFYDSIMLTVGLLINLVEDDSDNRHSLSRHPFCVRACRPAGACPCAVPAAAFFTDMFTHLRSTAETPEAKVLTVYLAVLLGCLMKDDVGNQATIRARLPGGSLASIASLLEQFTGTGGQGESHHHRCHPSDPAHTTSARKNRSLVDAMADPNVPTEALLQMHRGESHLDSDGDGGIPSAEASLGIDPAALPADPEEAETTAVMQSFRSIIDLLRGLEGQGGYSVV
ncbi:hypothetical protein IWQ60_011951 [Tieghemiomyces parasiticus]|uniref:Wings apart-like protein C-terminal domain-containing protein n=1 Tax=Tieghemiomyces parasiticus TaxID=78921 RepID=A0A9W8DL26_9FUNG|nr:hypothetical protein IWQ60_011951 [Tieghemiomyces parasiticus]